MITINSRSLAALLVGTFLVSPGIVAAKTALPSFNTEAKASEDANVVTGAETLTLSQSIYRIGLAESDPLLVIAAAKLSASVATRDLPKEPEEGDVGEDEVTEDGSDTDTVPATLAEMIEAARDLAGDDPVLIGMIDQIGTTATRGPVDGPLVGRGKLLKPRKSHKYEVELAPGRTVISVDGGGDGNLDLYVYNDKNRIVCKSERYSDRENCTLNVKGYPWATIIVKNRTRRSNIYNIRIR